MNISAKNFQGSIVNCHFGSRIANGPPLSTDATPADNPDSFSDCRHQLGDGLYGRLLAAGRGSLHCFPGRFPRIIQPDFSVAFYAKSTEKGKESVRLTYAARRSIALTAALMVGLLALASASSEDFKRISAYCSLTRRVIPSATNKKPNKKRTAANERRKKEKKNSLTNIRKP